MALALVGCGGGSGSEPEPAPPPVACTAPPPPPGSLTISGYVPDDGVSDGVFDPSLTEDGCGRVWMSYSAVRDTANGLRLVSTRIARANDAGSGWDDIGVAVNNAGEYIISPIGPLAGTWEHETSRLVYDPHDSDPWRRWKLIWHRYRWEQATPGSPGSPLFQHSWISLKTAPDPSGPWSGERKLIAGSLYDPADDNILGPPELRANLLDPALAGCLAFAEPGMLATAEGVYIGLKCATGAEDAGDVILLRCDHGLAAANCSYRGRLIAGTEAAAFSDVFGTGANSFSGFSAPELVRSNARNYLLVTPTDPGGYRGCLAFEVTDPESAALARDMFGMPLVKAAVSGIPGSFRGACGHTPGNSALGILYSQLVLTAKPYFRIYASGTSL